MKGFWEFVLALALYTFGGGVVGAVLGTWWILYLFISNNPGKTSTTLGALPVITAIVGSVLGALGLLVFATVKMARKK